MFLTRKQAIFIIFFENFSSKKYFFKLFLFSFALWKPEKNIKKIFFILSTGRNRFFAKFGTVSSPLNPMLFYFTESVGWFGETSQSEFQGEDG